MGNLSEKAKEMAESKFNYIDSDPWSGINKREYFAAKAMQGLLSDGAIANSVMDIAEKSVEMADALLEALSKP
jgi:hypothetical protein